MLLFLIGLRDEISQQLSFRVFIEKLFYNFWAICKSPLQFLDECNSSLPAFVFCFGWEGDEVEHLSESRTNAFSVEVFNFFCGEICCGVSNDLVIHQEIVTLQ